MGNKVEANIDIFDAIEFSFFMPPLIPETPNKRAVKIARKYNKPILETGDIHRLWQLETTYSLIKSEKKVASMTAA